MKGITFIRNLNNMSLQDVADRLNVTKQTINKWERELRPIPEVRLAELEKHFNVPREYFTKNLNEKDKIEIQEIKIRNEKLLLGETNGATVNKEELEDLLKYLLERIDTKHKEESERSIIKFMNNISN